MNIKQQQNPLPFLSGLVNTTTITSTSTTSTNLISGVEGGGGVEPFPQIIPSSLAIDSSFSSSSGSESPSLSLQTGIVDDSLSTIENQRIMQITSGTDTASTFGINDSPINLQIFIPELQMQKCLSVPLDEFIWDIKQRLFESLPQQLNQSFNYGLFLPPCDGRAGKFLLDDRPLRDYPFHDCAPYVELKYKKRVYKMLRLDEKTLRSVHSKNNLRKFSEAIQQKNIQKLDRLCQQGLDPNFHDSHGETPLTLASGIPDSRQVIVQLVGGGAHLDFRNTEGQTGMHKAAFLSVADNVRVMLELGASPNYKDLIGLTPLYYNMLNTESNPEVTEMLLAEAADLDIVDMHGNTALHQSCKNGLCKHTEQLIYYGANIDSKNINGNTPLHVCAVNGRVECAQLLLYRGANPSLINSNGQTAVQVAQIVGNMAVANVILGHSPQSVVPFLEPPRLNTRRRLSTRTISQDGSILRRRSLSHCSSSSSTIASNHLNRLSSNSNQINEQHKIRQNPSVISTSTSEYGTLRKIPPNSVQHQQPGFEPNTPRILVIPRGPKGFGFILRGARYADSMQLDFRPTLTIPALQFFEGVDMQGMAMRAGLRPGDFLLEINGVDVRSASHEQVVELIHQCGDTITLKVVTVDVDLLAKEQQLQNTQHLQQQIYASSTANYATVGRRNHSVPRLTNNTTTSSSTPPPPLPQRDPSTTLSFGKHSSSQFTAAVDVHNINNNYSSTSSNNNNNSCDIPSSPSISQQLTFIPIDNQHKQQQQQTTRCASVKLTKSVRRISAAELEHLMVQQGSSNNNNNNEQIDIIQNIGIPKKFTSVSEMKRRKQQQQSSNNVRSIDLNNNNSLIKNSISTPDLQSTEENIIYSEGQGIRSNKIILRPKTPPPPPPQSLWKNSLELGEEEEEENNEIICCQNSSSSIPIYASTVVIQSNQNISKGNGGGPPPPPPPPPPPINLLQRNSQPSTSSSIQKQLPNKKQSETINSSNCVDISAETLRSVRLRPVQQQKHLINNNNNKKEINNNKILSSPPKDFNSDLRSALARRRSKVKIIEETSESSGSGNEEINTKIVNISINKEEGKEKGNKIKQQQINNNNGGGILTNNNRYNRGLSLRESVLENVSGVATKCGQYNEKIITNSSHSPPGGFIGTKKDSGYTSSRTSLEPSECGDCENNGGNNNGNNSGGGIIITTTNNNNNIYNNSLPVKHRVNVLSQQLIDQQANNNNNNTSTNLLNKNFCIERDNVETFLRIPPVDYDQSENSSINSNNQQEEENNETNYSFNSNKEEEQKKIELIQKTGEFKQKPIKEWNYLDICEWLLFLELSEYCSSFSKIKGSDLLYFDRSRYTALGVTRIAHRQKMEQSIKDFNKNE